MEASGRCKRGCRAGDEPALFFAFLGIDIILGKTNTTASAMTDDHWRSESRCAGRQEERPGAVHSVVIVSGAKKGLSFELRKCTE